MKFVTQIYFKIEKNKSQTEGKCKNVWKTQKFSIEMFNHIIIPGLSASSKIKSKIRPFGIFACYPLYEPTSTDL